MAITIKGIRIIGVDIKLDKETGETKLSSAEYELVSSEDRVLAKQSIGGYQGIAVNPSAETIGLLRQFMESYRRDTTTVLGLE